MRQGLLKTTLLLSVLALLTGPAALASQAAPAPLGLWAWKTDESLPSKTLSIARSAQGWSARIDGQSVAVRVDGDALMVDDASGYRFKAALPVNGEPLRGEWIHPSSALGFSVMATPSVLAPQGQAAWEGTLIAQPRPFRVFLDVFERDEETFAIIRNPERNELQYSTIYRVSPDPASDGWLMRAGEGERSVEIKLGRLGPDTLGLPFRRFEEPLPLGRIAPADAPGFYSRQPESADTVAYTKPESLEDGWETAAAQDAGFDPQVLTEMLQTLARLDPRSRRPRQMHSLLVSHRGKLIIEEYFFGHKREDVHDLRSMGKMFGSILVGALRQQGVAIDPSDKGLATVYSPDAFKALEPGKAQITLGQLMSYSSGLDCDANDPESQGIEDNLWANGGPDFWRFAAELELKHQPGERYAYCSASINLAGATIRAKGGKPILETFDNLIAQPLGFSTYHWNLMPNGEAYLGGGAYIRPRDILKLGAVYAAGGQWKGQQIVPRDWVQQSTTPQIAITPETTGMSLETFENSYFGGEQAYVWRVDDIVVDGRSFDAYESTGNGGQILIVVPELELAAVMTGGNYRMGYIWGRWRDQVIGEGVLRAWMAAEAKRAP